MFSELPCFACEYHSAGTQFCSRDHHQSPIIWKPQVLQPVISNVAFLLFTINWQLFTVTNPDHIFWAFVMWHWRLKQFHTYICIWQHRNSHHMLADIAEADSKEDCTKPTYTLAFLTVLHMRSYHNVTQRSGGNNNTVHIWNWSWTSIQYGQTWNMKTAEHGPNTNIGWDGT
jgi:hypothetical protein